MCGRFDCTGSGEASVRLRPDASRERDDVGGYWALMLALAVLLCAFVAWVAWNNGYDAGRWDAVGCAVVVPEPMAAGEE